MSNLEMLMNLGEYRSIGVRDDGWNVVVTAEIFGTDNTFETLTCPHCGERKIRAHDAEAFRLERLTTGRER